MKWKRLILILVLALLVAFVVIFSYFKYNNNNNKEFDVGSVLLKTVIRAGGSYDSQLKIENLKDYGRHFDISFTNLENLAFANPESFDLGSGETRFVDVSFLNKENLSEGVYVGSVNILSEESSRQIPVILEIESEDVLFDSNVEIYPKTIFSGEQISAEIKIFDLSQIGTSSVELEYFIKDFFDEVIASGKENIVVRDQILITKPITLPEKIKQGDYVFGVTLKYKESIGTSSAFFRIDEEKFSGNFLSSNMLYLIIIFVFMILILLIFVLYSIYSRDKLLYELKGQYRSELRRQEEVLGGKEKKNEVLLKTKQEKTLNKKLFRKIKRERKREIGKIQKQRIKKIKVLKKQKKKNEMQSQINRWKKQGYDISVLEQNTKIPTVNDIRKQIKTWKEKGYDTKVLEK